VNWLLVFIPITAGLELAHAPHPWVFFSAAIAIVPIARLIVRSTEQLATYTGDAIGGLLNATFGNAPELIIALVALRAGLLDMVRASLAGAILANLLLALGIAFVAGGLRHHRQGFNASAARLYGSMMLIAALSLMVPSAFSRFLAPGETVREEALLNVGLAVVLLVAYALYLVFMLKTHPDEFAGEAGAADHDHGKRWSLQRAIGGLVIASVLAAWMSEILVGAAEGTGEALGMSQVFIGIVFLAIVGGAAESSSAIAMALRNKMDLTVGIALGSSIQIALFVAPVLVLASYFIAPQPLELSFSRAEVGALFMAAIIGTVVAGDGRANWYKGVQLVVVYLVIALMFYFIPTAAAAQETRGDRWAFTVTPYLWLPNVNGTLKYNPPPAGTGAPAVDTGPNNYLENLSMALMLSGEARKGRWSIVSDLVYIDFDGEKSNVRAVDFGRSTVDANGSSRSSLTGVEWTLAGGYTVLQTSRATLDAIGGFRYFHVNASSSWQLNATVTGPGAGQTFPASGSISRRADIWDGIVGVRGRVGLGEGRWFVPYYLDVGTGSSSLTWQSLVGVGYGFKWGDLVLAYRTLAYDQSDDKLFHDFRFSGTTLGASFRF
jgi:Ca2+:H+ antiporter